MYEWENQMTKRREQKRVAREGGALEEPVKSQDDEFFGINITMLNNPSSQTLPTANNQIFAEGCCHR